MEEVALKLVGRPEDRASMSQKKQVTGGARRAFPAAAAECALAQRQQPGPEALRVWGETERA